MRKYPNGFDEWSLEERVIWQLVEQFGYSLEDAVIKLDELQEDSEIYQTFKIEEPTE